MEAALTSGEDLEREIRERLSQGNIAGATESAVRGYGPEILGFLLAIHRDEDDTEEVFARFSEGLWRGIGSFAGQSSFRTWAYAIARKTSLKYRRNEGRRAARFARLPEDSGVSAIAALVRTQTLSHLRSSVRSRVVELRESLDPEEQELLMLRIDRGLSWNDLALVMAEGDVPLVGETLKRAAARLRKRFQVVKDKLREMVRREGLMEPGVEAR